MSAAIRGRNVTKREEARRVRLKWIGYSALLCISTFFIGIYLYRYLVNDVKNENQEKI